MKWGANDTLIASEWALRPPLKDAQGRPSASLVSSFLSVGGFMYLDTANRPTHATTLIPTDKAEGGLQFSPPRRWEAEWTTALMRQGRYF